jgi:hypothetical protein
MSRAHNKVPKKGSVYIYTWYQATVETTKLNEKQFCQKDEHKEALTQVKCWKKLRFYQKRLARSGNHQAKYDEIQNSFFACFSSHFINVTIESGMHNYIIAANCWYH